MSVTLNRQWRVARYPDAGELIDKSHFHFAEDTLGPLDQGEFLVKTICLAPGPAQRAYLETRYADFYGDPIPIGSVMRGRGIGEIVASKHKDYQVGKIFVGSIGWQDYSIQKPDQGKFIFSNRLIDNPIRPLSMHLGILGQAGGTAYFGLKEAGRIKPGDNVLVSAAAGGVGSVAGQIARIKDAGIVVGISSTDQKCQWLCNELGYDVAINYKSENLDNRIRELFPDGVDVFFDNVGGEILNTCLKHLAMNARIALGGYISTQYNEKIFSGPTHYTQLINKRASMQGFVYFDYWDRYAEAEQALVDWYHKGLLTNSESIDEGLEMMPKSLASLFTGENRGIKLCRVSPDP
ncbi:MAG: NADP-dependent oxidoreductase [Pseudomonadota bacterium]|nr:NADP-dependent oxidoreductase [Pseudomonadota bacterium]